MTETIMLPLCRSPWVSLIGSVSGKELLHGSSMLSMLGNRSQGNRENQSLNSLTVLKGPPRG